MTKTKKMLDWFTIEKKLVDYAISDEAKKRCATLDYMTDPFLIRSHLEETTESRAILNYGTSIPLHSLNGIGEILDKIKRDEILRPLELTKVQGFIKDTQKMIRFMSDKVFIAPKVAMYAQSMSPLHSLCEEISLCIANGVVLDTASTTLLKLRKKIEHTEEQIKSKLQSYLSSSQYSSMLSDAIISQRDGKYVLPIKSEHKRNFDGNVLDRSRSGGTFFVEPAAVKKLHDTLQGLKIDEENEVYKILTILTEQLASQHQPLYVNYECMIAYDFLFAKAKLSLNMNACSPEINLEKELKIINGRHPLLGKEPVPLSLELNQNVRNLIITGPNTGGKTVAMKTTALFSLMAQSGLHVPADPGTRLPLFKAILCDIGDGQSVEQNLSTFSSHITNINEIVDLADADTLVIIDEIGAGTDPSEGMGIGIAVLEHLNLKGCFLLASTHYNEIKRFAEMHPDFSNGSMAFDLHSLQPLYKLEVGKSGESNALHIALRIGMSKHLIERAHEIAYKEKKNYEPYKMSSPKKEVQPLLKNSETRHFSSKKQVTFSVGDAVFIHTMKRTGIVCERMNRNGEVGVMVMNKKIWVSHKRLSLYLEGKDLYPEAYDLDIATKTKSTRKKEKALSKGVKGIILETD